MEQRVHPEAHSSRNYSDASILKMRVRIIPKKSGKKKGRELWEAPGLVLCVCGGHRVEMSKPQG
jgi:hypothetical protein